MTETISKLQLDEPRRVVTAGTAQDLLTRILRDVGCSEATAELVAAHLTEASLSGVESHGLMRVLQYVEQFESGHLQATAEPRILRGERGHCEIDGDGGLGIPAMQLAVETACRLAKESGITALPIRNLGHTGRLGSFAEVAARAGCMMILMGGGKRQDWRQVAPHGGRRALLPTNPYCIGIPGGDRGPVVLDFATSKIAGGWVYAARSAGARLPADALIDAEGHPSQDPEDYYRGGAILPAGGAKGYALALVAELVAEAMLGPTTTECNWLMIALDCARHRPPETMQAVAEEILAELRACPPAPGFRRVEIPGERERDLKAAADGEIAVPEETWKEICDLAERLGKNPALRPTA